ncbi:MAG: GPR endopeptidase [Clostridia bacterium]|nr:GPR endopeptidase [Clostridia bacterium]
MKSYARSDLACESFLPDAGGIKGAQWQERKIGSVTVSTLRIKTETAEKELQKPKGTYVTLECPRLDRLSKEESDVISHLLAGELRGMAQALTNKKTDSEFSVFVAGLGNADLTADAIGPKTVSKLTATRHLREHEAGIYRAFGCSAVSALAPGVLGQTGIETSELLKGVISRVKPDLVLVIDALAARSCERLASTVQLSDTGIEPGAGVGNHRSAISQRTLGVPVIALGIPTVVDSATLVYDALCKAGIREIGDSLSQVLNNGRSFFVSPKESDVISDKAAALFAYAVSLAFAGELAEGFGE